MIKQLKAYYTDHPLKTILFAGFFFRLLAVIFSKGYGWVDDQFLVVEIAQSWVDGMDYYHWLPDKEGLNIPKGFSFFYTGIHYLLFQFLEWVHITSPQGKMYIVRLLHALWSLLIISGGYKIAMQIGGKPSAVRTGWLLSVLWLFPFLSVRNLVEYVSIPLLIYGIWLIIQDKPKKEILWIWIGILFGLAFNIRFQTLLFTGGVGLVLLYQKKWKETFLVASGVVLTIIVIQGGVDYLAWKKPFVQLIGYVNYNMHHAREYLTAPWYFYVTVITGLLIPPVSVYLFVGYFRCWKNTLIFFFPTLLFLLFHSIFPNKQERFIITIIPFIIIGGVIGWNMITQHIERKAVIVKWHNGTWVFFWFVNFILLLPVSTMYSKKARVESMVYLSNYNIRHDLLIEDIHKSVLRQPPLFYLHQWVPFKTLMAYDDPGKYKSMHVNDSPENQPDFILFLEKTDIEERVNFMKSVYQDIEFETVIHPGNMDKILHWLNPINANQNIYIYRNKAVQPDKVDND